eukprot:5141759-Prymnesium_polylepis.1
MHREAQLRWQQCGHSKSSPTHEADQAKAAQHCECPKNYTSVTIAKGREDAISQPLRRMGICRPCELQCDGEVRSDRHPNAPKALPAARTDRWCAPPRCFCARSRIVRDRLLATSAPSDILRVPACTVHRALAIAWFRSRDTTRKREPRTGLGRETYHVSMRMPTSWPHSCARRSAARGQRTNTRPKIAKPKPPRKSLPWYQPATCTSVMK